MKIWDNKRNIFILSVMLFIAMLVSLHTVKKAVSKFASDFFSPYLGIPNRIADNLSNQSLLLRSKLSLAATVEELQIKINELYGKSEMIKGIESENAELRKLLGLTGRPEYKCIFAEILMRDPIYWDEYFNLRQGSDSGIVEGAIVMAKVGKADKGNPNGLAVIGRVRRVTKNTAVVDTIISGETKLSVSLAESHTSGVIQYGGRNGSNFWTIASYLPRNISYTPGEAVYTSGLSGYTPGGLYVGRLSEKPEDIKVHDNLYIEVKVNLAANLDDLRFVIVLVKK